MNSLSDRLMKIARAIVAEDEANGGIKIVDVKGSKTTWVEPNGDKMSLWLVKYIRNGAQEQLTMAATDKEEAKKKTLEFLNSIYNQPHPRFKQ